MFLDMHIASGEALKLGGKILSKRQFKCLCNYNEENCLKELL